MSIELVKLTIEYKEQLFDMLTEWKNDIMANHTDMSPWKIWTADFHDFDSYLKSLNTLDAKQAVISATESGPVKEERALLDSAIAGNFILSVQWHIKGKHYEEQLNGVWNW